VNSSTSTQVGQGIAETEDTRGALDGPDINFGETEPPISLSNEAGHGLLGASDAEMAEGDAPTPASAVLPVVYEQQPKPRRSVD
jgi:hypothetical protein